MRTVNYKSGKQIQEMKVYTVDEVLTGLKIRSNDSYGQSIYIEAAIAGINLPISSRDKPLKLSRREKLRTLAKSTAKLKKYAYS